MVKSNNIAAVILAAGSGTRLNKGKPSPKPKVLYELAGKPMIFYILETLRKIGLKEIIVVVGYKRRVVEKTFGNRFKYALQKEQLGTANALAAGLKKVSRSSRKVLVLNGDDSAFYKPQTLKQVLDKDEKENGVLTFVTLRKEDPFGLGRVLRTKNGKLLGIVEEREAKPAEKKIKEINDGCYIFNKKWLELNLGKVKKSTSGEYYLVDLISIAIKKGFKINTFELKDQSEWFGINTPSELREADKKMIGGRK